MAISKRHLTWWATGAGVLLAIVVGILAYLHTADFQRRVAAFVQQQIYTSTGARAEMGRFRFGFRPLSIDMAGVILHGREARVGPPGQPPLAQIDHVYLGLTIVALFQGKVDLSDVVLDHPHVHIYTLADGNLNLPTPPVSKPSGAPLQTLFDLGIRTLRLDQGELQFNQRRLPLSALLHQIAFQLAYRAPRPGATGLDGQARYDGSLRYASSPIQYGAYLPLTEQVSTEFSLWPNDVRLSKLELDTEKSRLLFHGFLHNLNALELSGDYQALLNLPELAHVARVQGLESGSLSAAGKVAWKEISNAYSADGHLRIADLRLRRPLPNVGVWNGTSDLSVDNKQAALAKVLLRGLGGEILGDATYVFPVPAATHTPARPAELNAKLHLRDLSIADLRPMMRGQMGGGNGARLAQRWEGSIAGDVQARARGAIKPNLQLTLALSVTPPRQAAPGAFAPAALIQATALPFRQTADLQRLVVSLPETRVAAHGLLARGNSQLQFTAESQNLGDLNPILSLLLAPRPVPPLAGVASLSGTASGPLNALAVTAHVQGVNLHYDRYFLDRLQANLTLSPSELAVDPLIAGQGAQTLTASGTVGLDHYALPPDGPIALHVMARNLDLLALQRQIPALAAAVPTTGAQPAHLAQAVARPPAPRSTPPAAKPQPTVAQVAAAQAGRPVAQPGAAQSGTAAPRPPANAPSPAPQPATPAPAITGLMNVTANITGTRKSLSGTGHVNLSHAVVYRQPFPAASADVAVKGQTVSAHNIQVHLAGTVIAGTASYNLSSRDYSVNLASGGIELARLPTLQSQRLPLAGVVTLKINGAGNVAHPQGTAQLLATHLRGDGEDLGTVRAQIVARDNLATLNASDQLPHGNLTLRGRVGLDAPHNTDVTLDLSNYDADAWLRRFTPATLSGHSRVSGFAHITGPLSTPAELTAELRLDPVEAAIGGLVIQNQGPIVATLAHQLITLQPAHVVAEDTDLQFGGTIPLAAGANMNVRADGHVNLALIHLLRPETHSSGQLSLNATINGPVRNPQVNGSMRIADGSIAEEGLPIGFDRIQGLILFSGQRVEIQNLTAVTGGGLLSVGGTAAKTSQGFDVDLFARGQNLRVRYQGISLTGSTNLRLTGEQDDMLLSGEAQLNRIGLTNNFDLAVFIAQSRTTPVAPSPDSLLSRTRLDVHLTTGPQVELATNIARLQMQADLRLRGTAANPILLGRASASQGAILFAGNQYTISKAEVQFANPFHIEPLLDVGLATRVQQYDVTLNVTGSVDKLNISYRSDPPLSSSDIISLLATGQTQEARYNLSQESTTTFVGQSEQLLGKALDNVVSSRVERLFGITQISVSPNFAGSGNVGRGTVTIQQQVSRNLKLIYTQNLSTSSQDIIQVDWTINRHLGITLNRDQFGIYGVKFNFSHRMR